MPKGSFTSAALTELKQCLDAKQDFSAAGQGKQVREGRAIYPQLGASNRVRMVQSRRYFVTPPAQPSWSSFFEEFHCRGCGGTEAYRSRPRGFFERYVLPLLLLQVVRCKRCYHRSYVWSTIPAIERNPTDRKQSQSEAVSDSKSDGRVA